jgi:hypothetical protein
MNVFLVRAGLEIRRKWGLERESVTIAATLPGGLGEVLQAGRLGGSTTARGELANVVEEDGALEVVEL